MTPILPCPVAGLAQVCLSSSCPAKCVCSVSSFVTETQKGKALPPTDTAYLPTQVMPLFPKVLMPAAKFSAEPHGAW